MVRVIEEHRQSALHVRALIVARQAPPTLFRAWLTSIPSLDRDAWLDLVLGLDAIPDDAPDLPQGCVPYLPCAVDALLRTVELANVQETDVFVDVGSGVGRAAVLVHLLTGASTVGLEIQPALVAEAHALLQRLGVSRFLPLLGDASEPTRLSAHGTVFFLYCPFSGERLAHVLDDLESVARTRTIRLCCVDLPIPSRPWLALLSRSQGDVEVYQSTFLVPPAG